MMVDIDPFKQYHFMIKTSSFQYLNCAAEDMIWMERSHVLIKSQSREGLESDNLTFQTELLIIILYCNLGLL
jgi:hypothetical protein